MVATVIPLYADDGTTPVGNISAINTGGGVYKIQIEALPATTTIELVSAAGIVATATTGNIDVTAAAGNVALAATLGDITATAAAGDIAITATAGGAQLTAAGGGVTVPDTGANLKLATAGETRIDIDPDGGVFIVGDQGVSPDATTGFTYLPVVTGPPVGTPAVEQAAFAAVCFDRFTGNLWVRVDGEWRFVPTNLPATGGSA